MTREQYLALGNKLAPAAATLARLRNLLLDPDTAMDEILRLVRLDPALTYHVVRMSNSVLFGLRERTDSLDIAVARVGLSEVFRLVGLAAVQQVCQNDLLRYRLKAVRIWENAVATAAAAEVLAGRAGRDPGLAYTAGLMRTIGRVVLDAVPVEETYPGEAEWPSVADWEIKVFGTTATEVTTQLLEYWRFPGDVIESIDAHFDPLASSSSNVGACVLNLACGVSARFGLDLPGESGNWICTPAKLTLAGVSEADLEDCATRARAHYVLLCASVV
ncbi:HDOD domain-containing protein [Opitutus sp. ER46]|uniref:HDOD domain-containing protein n=1 Tax=Opitutus sp. ER46 TaxID=2161864 RepID=UPI001E57485D|nr:HDOD domain-containing protein [Opitutus sp. ER46]